PDGPAIVWHHGTPDSGGIYRLARESAEQRGLRLLAYDRPGYGGSTPHPGRTVADAAVDVGAILDELGVERFATYGLSGGGPHATVATGSPSSVRSRPRRSSRPVRTSSSSP